MEQKKWRVVCYINQFFGQIGGEEMAHVGFSVKHEAVGPAKLFQNLLKDSCEVVATVICGDNYFAGDMLQAASAISPPSRKRKSHSPSPPSNWRTNSLPPNSVVSVL